MITSENGIQFIKAHEGCVLHAYKALPTEDYYTIGFGHYGADVKPGSVITMDQALSLLRKDLNKFESNVMKYNPVYHWNQNEFDAMVSYAYNIGSINKLVDNGKRTKGQIASDIPNHNTAKGKVIPALTKRRIDEQAIFLKKEERDMYYDPHKVIVVAAGEKGYLEKASQNSLYDKTANAGSNNYTKYWEDIKK